MLYKGSKSDQRGYSARLPPNEPHPTPTATCEHEEPHKSPSDTLPDKEGTAADHNWCVPHRGVFSHLGRTRPFQGTHEDSKSHCEWAPVV